MKEDNIENKEDKTKTTMEGKTCEVKQRHKTKLTLDTVCLCVYIMASGVSTASRGLLVNPANMIIHVVHSTKYLPAPLPHTDYLWLVLRLMSDTILLS
jgi:hypothetical protein